MRECFVRVGLVGWWTVGEMTVVLKARFLITYRVPFSKKQSHAQKVGELRSGLPVVWQIVSFLDD